MTIEQQYIELQKFYFLKCKELADIENHLNEFKNQLEIRRKQELKNKRIKLKNSIYKPKIN